MWTVKTKVMSVIIWATGIISKSLSIPEQCTEKPHQGITENSHIGYSTDTAGSADVKVENFQHGKFHYLYHIS
jgi:hypothetical protein